MVFRKGRMVALAAVGGFFVGAVMIAPPSFAAPPTSTLPPGVTFSNNGTIVEPDYELSIDCALLPDVDGYTGSTVDFLYLPIEAGESVVASLANCDFVENTWSNTQVTSLVPAFRFLDGSDAGELRQLGTNVADGETVAVTGTQVELFPNSRLLVKEADADPTGYFLLDTRVAVRIADPAGELLDEFVLDLPAAAQADMVVADDPQYYYGEFNRLGLGGLEDCGITAGRHFAATTTVTIERAGTYTFRVTDITPPSVDVDQFQPFRYLTDPFLALYRTFDPADPHTGVIGCNDDSDLDENSTFLITSAGTMMSDRFPQFSVLLQPGTYTLVLTSFDDLSEFEVASELAPATGGDHVDDQKGVIGPAALGEDESGTVQMWFAPADLAATGPNGTTGLVLALGTALLSLGAMVLVGRRRMAR